MTPDTPESTKDPAYVRIATNLSRRTSTGIYYALVKRAGKQFRMSLKTKDGALARRLLAEYREQVTSLVSTDAGTLTFDILAKRWEDSQRHALKDSTSSRRKHYLDGLKPYFTGMTLRSITQAHCESWLTGRGAGLSPETFNHELGVMKKIFEYARDQGFILRNPAKSIKRKRVLPSNVRAPSKTEFAQIVATIRASDGRAASKRLAKAGADLVELLAYSGCRLGEALQLTWSDVTWPSKERPGTIRVTGGKRRTKNYESRTVPLTDALFGLLSRLQSEKKPEPTDCIVTIKSAKKALATACRNLKFPNFTHHAMRHFFASSCIASGVEIPTFSKWLGHKDGGLIALKIYGHLSDDHSFAQIKRVSFAPVDTVTPAMAPVQTDVIK